MKYVLFVILFSFAFLETKRQIVIKHAREKIGSTDWEYESSNTSGKDRKSDNGKVFFCDYEPKCNLFVYEMLAAADIEIELNNKMGIQCSLFHWDEPNERPPTVKDWYEGTVEGMELVGQGSDGIWNSMPGDILVEYNKDKGIHHMGIISGTQKTISACADQICETGFGWDSSTVKIFRYE